MSKILKFTLILAVLFQASTMLFAQNAKKTVPLDPTFKHGVLENGLTYYIRHNEEPKGRASFYMVQNVGAMLENDDQNGLAHFLEHMAFNGTKHYPGKGFLDYLENLGVTFGKDINAYTATDETVYNISNVPTTREGILDSSLLVLHDWSNYLLLTDEEIDAERGVITEEWRTRRNAQFRMRNTQQTKLYAGSKYSKRDVIGSLDVIKNHKYQTLIDFYNKWYRTDLQAIIIIGDFDAVEMEKKVKKLFSPIPAIKNPAERVYYDLPDNKGARYVLSTDKEATGNIIHLQFKYNPVARKDKSSTKYLRSLYAENLFSTLMANRVNERLQQENPPFIFAQMYMSEIVRTKNAAGIYMAHKAGQWKEALKGVAEIVENVRDYGFTQGELDRAMINITRSTENDYKQKNKRSNDSYAREMKYNYLKGNPVAGIEYELNFVKTKVSTITLKEINALSQRFFTDDNVLITVSGPESAEAVYPTKEEILKVISEVKAAKLDAYTDSFEAKALISNLPKAGTITKTEKIAELDAKVLTLSNGIKVYLKHSTLEKEKISFSAFSWGGFSKLENSDISNSQVFGSFIPSFGIGEFSSVELGKLLTGKIVKANASLSNLNEGITASSSPEDLETMMQLVHLSFTNPRFDEQSFNALRARYMAYVQNLKNDINTAFKDSISEMITNHNPRNKPFGVKTIEEITFTGISDIYKERFHDAGDFVFVISGDFDESILNKYIEQYIATLAVYNEKEMYEDRGVRPPSKNINNHFTTEMTTPKVSVYVNYNKEVKYSEQNNIFADIIGKLLGKRYLEEIREKEGGTYGVGVRASIKRRPYEAFELKFQFDCEPGKQDKLKGLAIAEIDKMLKGEINKVDLEEIKTNYIKERKQAIENVDYWHNQLMYFALNNDFSMNEKEFDTFINSIDSKIIVKKTKEFLKKAVKVEVVMSPKQ